MSNEQEIPNVNAVASEIRQHTGRLIPLLHQGLKDENPVAQMQLAKQVLGELADTVLPLVRDLANATAELESDVQELNDEVFGIKVPIEAAEETVALFAELSAVATPEQRERMDALAAAYAGDEDDEDDDEDGEDN